MAVVTEQSKFTRFEKLVQIVYFNVFNFQLSKVISWFLHGVANLATGLPAFGLDT
jgi:hypothetical protein